MYSIILVIIAFVAVVFNLLQWFLGRVRVDVFARRLKELATQNAGLQGDLAEREKAVKLLQQKIDHLRLKEDEFREELRSCKTSEEQALEQAHFLTEYNQKLMLENAKLNERFRRMTERPRLNGRFIKKV